jgi:hypothetical protein
MNKKKGTVMKKWEHSKKFRYLSAYALFALTFLYIQGSVPAHASPNEALKNCYNACTNKKPDKLTDPQNPSARLSTCWGRCDAQYKD